MLWIDDACMQHTANLVTIVSLSLSEGGMEYLIHREAHSVFGGREGDQPPVGAPARHQPPCAVSVSA